jgi:hypothetical protein
LCGAATGPGDGDDDSWLVVHGGLAGDDTEPLRLNDTWVLELHLEKGGAFDAGGDGEQKA